VIGRTAPRLCKRRTDAGLSPESGRVGIIETGGALAACLLVLVIAVVLDRRPYRPGKRNYIPVMIIALAASLVLGRHLLTLLTAHPQ